MFIVHVYIHVKEEFVEAFKAIAVENARNSVQEPGVARFDVVQEQDDPTRFVLLEAYRTPEDVDRHKETTHYKAWAEAVGEMLAEPRSRTIFTNVFPDENGWG